MDLGWIFRHCFDVKRSDGGYLPVRMSDEMLDVYSREGVSSRIRAWDTSGVTMEFEVDGGTEFSFSYTADSYCRRHCVFDFYENGVFATSVREPDESHHGRVDHVVGGKGPVRVCVYLPYSARVVISDIDIPGIRPSTTPKARRALYLGDSITQGMEVFHPSLDFPVLLGKRLGWDWVNQGVGGAVFDQDHLGDVRTFGADEILVAYGTNDFTAIVDRKVSFTDVCARIDSYMERLADEAGAANVHVLTPLWRMQNQSTRDDRDVLDCVREKIRTAAVAQGFEVIDGLAVSAHVDGLYIDGLHPNDAGALFVANEIARCIER